MTGPFQNPTKWVAVLIFLLHMLQKVWPPDCAEYICKHLYIFCSPSCPYKVRGPRRNSYNMVSCFAISCAYSHKAEDTPREVLKTNCEFLTYHAPTKWQASFQAPTRWVCVVVLFSPSNMQLKTLDSSKLLGFLTPIMWFLPKNTDTHREQHDHLLICFLMVLSLETEKKQRTLLWFYSLQVGFLVRFGFTTK